MGRAAELESLTKAFLTNDVTGVLVTGVPGVGKTALLLEFAHRAREQRLFEGGVAWLTGRSVSAASNNLDEAVGEALGVPAVDVARWLRTGRCLLVIDGVDEVELPNNSAGLLVLPHLIEMAGRTSKVLAAARSAPVGLDGVQVMQLGGLGEEGARALLASLADADGEEPLPERDLARLLEVVRALDYHPLASLIAVRLLESRGAGSGTELEDAGRQLRNLLAHAGAAGEQEWRQWRAAVLHTLGTVYQERGDLDRAVAAYEESLGLAREGGDTATMQATLGNLGSLALQEGKLGRANAHYEEALALASDRGDARGQAQVLFNLGVLHHLRGSDADARRVFGRSLSLAWELGDPETALALLQRLSALLREEGGFTEAMRLLQTVLEGAKSPTTRAGVASALETVATVEAETGGDLEWARALVDQALAVARELGDRASEGARLATLGAIDAQRGELDCAANALEQSVGIAEELGDVERLPHRLVDLARLYARMGREQAGIATYQRALTFYRHISDSESTATVALELGRLLVDLGRWYDGLALLEDSLALRRTADDALARADVIYELGRTQHLMGNLDEARVRYRDAARLYERAGNAHGLAATRASIGRLMIQLNLPEDARRELEAARTEFEALGETARLVEIEEVLRLVSRVRDRQVA